MKPLIVGDLYMMKLKQSSKKGFSARSTGALSRKGTPEKSFKTKAHQDLYSTTPIRIGDQEGNNSLIGVSPENIAKMHLFYRSSVIGRRDLGKKLVKTIKKLKDFNYTPDFKNRNVEILQAYLKSMGIRIEFIDDMYNININSGNIESFETDTLYFIGTQSEYEDCAMKDKILRKYANDVCFVGTSEEFEDMVNQEFEDTKMRNECYVIDIN